MNVSKGINVEPSTGSVSGANFRMVDSQVVNSQASRLSILLAEDNFVNQRLAIMLLERLGYCVDVVDDGEAVLLALQRQAYDVVLMDVYIPRMCGITATQKIIQRYPPEQRPYIIALTACTEDREIDRCLAAGMQDYIFKPIDPVVLAQALQRAEQSAHLSGEVLQQTLVAGEGDQNQVAQKEGDQMELAVLDEPVLDEQVIDYIRRMAGAATPRLLKQLVESYLGEVPAMLEGLYQSIAMDDCVAMYKAAHRLRSSSVTLGAMQLAQLCALIEDKGHADVMVVLDEYKPLLETTFRATQAAFIRLLEE